MNTTSSPKYSLKELSKLLDCSFEGNENFEVNNIDSLETATASDVSFLSNSKYLNMLHKSKAGIICIHPDIERLKDKNYLISTNPSNIFKQITKLFITEKTLFSGFIGIHPTAIIHPSCQIGKNVRIGPYAVLDQNSVIENDVFIDSHSQISSGVVIEENARIGAHVSIGFKSKIGKQCVIHSHVVIREETLIGDKVIIQPGAVIGSCGFGYITDDKGHHTKIEQIGNAIIEKDVEIGALTAIDRGRFKSTIISENTKIDNLVQIAHNVQVGPSNLIVSQVGIAGSTKTGKNVVLGGQVGVVGHIEIGDYAGVSAQSGVSKSLPPKQAYRGTPAQPIAEYQKEQVYIRRIKSMGEKIAKLEEKINLLEKNLD